MAQSSVVADTKYSLFRGHLVFDVDVPSMLLDQCAIRDGNEFTKMRYSAVTCDPNDFVVGFLHLSNSEKFADSHSGRQVHSQTEALRSTAANRALHCM